MHWRTILAVSFLLAWLLYKWVPIESAIIRFLISGLCFSLNSRMLVVVWYKINHFLTAPKINIEERHSEALKTATLVRTKVAEQQRIQH